MLYVEGDLRVVGTVEGELEVTGSVEIDDGGRVTGPVTARDRLVVGRAGSLMGDVRVARLVVKDGATFSGKVSMGKQAEAPPKRVEPVTEPVKAEARVTWEAPVKPAEPVKAVVEPVKTEAPAKAPQPVRTVPPVTPVLPVKPVQTARPAQAPRAVQAVKPAQPVRPAKAAKRPDKRKRR
jgi:cytoskeletal protein CcmA (bactofilin family)